MRDVLKVRLSARDVLNVGKNSQEIFLLARAVRSCRCCYIVRLLLASTSVLQLAQLFECALRVSDGFEPCFVDVLGDATSNVHSLASSSLKPAVFL